MRRGDESHGEIETGVEKSTAKLKGEKLCLNE